MRTSPQRGFTLIELLVVIAIIGLLSSIVLASLSTAKAKGNDAQRLAEMRSVVNALQLYSLNHNGTFPATPTAGSACGTARYDCVGNLSVLETEGYISELPADPTKAGTGTNYLYAASGGVYTLLLNSQTLPGGLITAPTTGGWCRPEVPVEGATTWMTFMPCR